MLVQPITIKDYQIGKNNKTTNFKGGSLDKIKLSQKELVIIENFVTKTLQAAKENFSNDAAANFTRFMAATHLDFLKNLPDGRLETRAFESFIKTVEAEFEKYLDKYYK